VSNFTAVKLGVEPARYLAFGSITADYLEVGTPITNPVRILRIQNLTDAILWFSYDGENDHEAMAANSFLLLDVTANKSLDNGLYIPLGTQIYVKRLGTPTTGSVYVSVYYGSTDL
jgi:hypothetical protein